MPLIGQQKVTVAEITYEPSDVAGVDLGVYAQNGDGDFTGGNAANSMIVSLTYLIFNITTGQFE